MNTKFFDIDSTYRNRELWPSPGEFEIPISQYGTKPICQSLDPVALAAPITTWRSNNFEASVIGSSTIVVDISSDPISATNDSRTFIVSAFPGSLHTEFNYYRAAIAELSTVPPQQQRIASYRFLGNDGVNDRAEFTMLNGFSSTPVAPQTLTITDPTDFTNLCFPLIFIPAGRLGSNAYPNFLLYNESRNDYREITNYDALTHIAEIDTSIVQECGTTQKCIPATWSTSDVYSIRSEPPVFVGTVLNVVNGKIILSNNRCYECGFLRITDSRPVNASFDETRRITSCCVYTDPTTGIKYNALTICQPFTETNIIGFEIEVLQISYDNAVPFSYSGTYVQEEVCYEIELHSIVLPNNTLVVGQGSRIAFYPYIYVEFTNTSGSSAGMYNQIYSNNPNAARMLFRIGVTDTTDPGARPFIILYGGDMTQTVKFRPNDNLKFSVRLGNGEIYNTIIPEAFSPSQPNPDCQIRALFSIKRV